LHARQNARGGSVAVNIRSETPPARLLPPARDQRARSAEAGAQPTQARRSRSSSRRSRSRQAEFFAKESIFSIIGALCTIET
jgi:hypothetical protein